MRTILSFFIGIVLLLAVGLWAGCGGDDSSAPSDSGSVAITASTTHLGDLARNVAGDRGEVTQILAANSDAHDYEPQPSDAESVLDSDLILTSGGDLDIWMEQVVESSGSEAATMTMLDRVQTIEGEGHSDEEEHEGEEHAEGELQTDPHWWQDPGNAIIATEAIRDELIAVDPEGEATYTENADAYIAELEDLDAQIGECIDQVPEDDRKLITSHDALGYYADRYDIEVIGAAIPALTTQAQASAGETADLVDTIREAGVPTIFAEAGVSQELEQAIADEAGASVGAELWADTLGPEGSDGATYIEAMATNTANLVDGFTGGEQSCSIDIASS